MKQGRCEDYETDERDDATTSPKGSPIDQSRLCVSCVSMRRVCPQGRPAAAPPHQNSRAGVFRVFQCAE